MNTKITKFEKQKPKLNEGQIALLKLIESSYENQFKITLQQLIKIYKSHVQRYKKRETVTYDHEEKCYVGIYVSYKKIDIERAAITWTFRTIGSLVLKGYLIVIPKIQLRELTNENM